jgi:hypothetical protein
MQSAGCVLILAALGIAPAIARQEERPRPAGVEHAPKLHADKDRWEFGQVWQGEPVAGKFILENSGDAPLEITNIKASCICTLAELSTKTLAPGQKIEMPVKLDSEKKTGEVSTYITISSNDPKEPRKRLYIHGTVRRHFEMTPGASIVFGRVSEQGEKKASIEIENKTGKPGELKLKSGHRFLDMELVEVEKNRRWRLDVATRPPMVEGVVRVMAEIETGLAERPKLQIPVSMVIVPRVSFSPKQILLPPNTPRASERLIRVAYTEDQPVKIKAVKVENTDQIEALLVPDEKLRPLLNFVRHEIRVRVPAGVKIESDDARIIIETDDKEYARLVVPIKQSKGNFPLRPSKAKVVGKKDEKADQAGKSEDGHKQDGGS